MATHLRPADRPASDSSSDDLFADTRMSFGMHLEELRTRLWRAVTGFVAILTGCLLLDAVGWATDTRVGVARPVLELIAQPVEEELGRIHEERKQRVLAALGEERKEIHIEIDVSRLAELLGLAPRPPEDAPRFARLPARVPSKTWVTQIDETQRLLGPSPSLRTLGPTEAMMVYFKTALVCGFVLGSPWIFWQLWAFVAAGLYPNEKRLVHVHLPFAVGLFLGGVLFCQFLVMPSAVAALLAFNEWLGFQPDLRLSEWVGFAVLMPVVFGVAFQTPLVMRLLERLGILTVADYRAQRRMAWFVMAVAAAVITPSLDAVNLLFLWVPMGLLYELGIVLCRLAPRERAEASALDAGELVEV